MTVIIEIGPPERINRPWRRLSTCNPDFVGAQDELGSFAAVWRVADGLAWRIGVPNALEHPSAHFRLSEGQSFEDAVAKHHQASVRRSGWIVQPLNIPPGSYFARMARPHHEHPGDRPSPFYPGFEYANERATALQQLSLLTGRLSEAFQTVHPEEANFATYGSEFRNILILAATEVEAQWKGILVANQYTGSNGRLTTNDYVKLEPALRLADYAVRWPQYPWMNAICPFGEWEQSSPTRSLDWYHAYNSVKHDREQNFAKASLLHAIKAVAAVYVMIGAQFGFSELIQASNFRDVYQLTRIPKWTIGDTHGFLHHERTDWEGTATPYPFD
jgi:hypothetical protein